MKEEITKQVELPEMEQDVTTAGADQTQVTGQEAGRVVGFSCDDD